MTDNREIDLKAAINSISDVVQNRPRPLREFDQIYMKTGDMVLQCEMVARWANNKSVAFIGDGDAISVGIAYLKNKQILDYGPNRIVIYDFDERICNAITKFANKEDIPHLIANLYNCVDAFPEPGEFDCFYSNPPWGSTNRGESVKIFTQRGMEATGNQGEGIVVIADDHELAWSQKVLAATQLFALKQGFYIQKMASRVHQYHLDDNPELRSCNLYLKALPDNKRVISSHDITNQKKLDNFYGRDQPLKVQYVKEIKRVDYGKAHDSEYLYELRGSINEQNT